jgi:pimeloyl-CoA dehydrogenase small subunit
MDFDLNEEQNLLKDSVDRLLNDRYGFRQRAAYSKSTEGWSKEIWTQFAELGLLGLPFAESDGGFGGGAVETMIVMEALGRKLVLEPYLATIVLGGGLLRHAADAEQRARLVPEIAAGKTTLAFAHSERQSRYELADVATRARQEGEGWIISGEKSLVLNGDTADTLIVSARVAGTNRSREGLALFLVGAGAPGLTRRGYPTQDGLRAAEISLADVRVSKADVLGTPGTAFPVIARVVDEAIAALCAEAVGAMTVLHELTVEYLKTRKQFGVTIGSFQVLQHRAVDMLVAIEQARSMAFLATMMAEEDNPVEREKAIAAAKVQIGKSARLVGQEATQLHGGIGMTMEYEGGAYFKRLTMINILFGDVDHHLRRLARAGGFIGAAG